MIYAAEVTNVVPGIFSKKVVSNGLHLPATNTFSPITTNHYYSTLDIFLHYQISLTEWKECGCEYNTHYSLIYSVNQPNDANT